MLYTATMMSLSPLNGAKPDAIKNWCTNLFPRLPTVALFPRLGTATRSPALTRTSSRLRGSRSDWFAALSAVTVTCAVRTLS